MICPDSDLDCDNPGCRRGGCQGRRPDLPLFRALAAAAPKDEALGEPAFAGGASGWPHPSMRREERT